MYDQQKYQDGKLFWHLVIYASRLLCTNHGWQNFCQRAKKNRNIIVMSTNWGNHIGLQMLTAVHKTTNSNNYIGQWLSWPCALFLGLVPCSLFFVPWSLVLVPCSLSLVPFCVPISLFLGSGSVCHFASVSVHGSLCLVLCSLPIVPVSLFFVAWSLFLCPYAFFCVPCSMVIAPKPYNPKPTH